MAANILVFGDSIAYGCYDSGGGWVDRLKRYYLNDDTVKNRPLNRYVYNLAISGDTSSEILKRIKLESTYRSWDDRETIYLFAFGINDPIIINGINKTHEKKFKKNINEIIKYCKNKSDKLIFLGPTQVDEAKVSPMPWSLNELWQNERIRNYSNIMKTVCKEHNLDFLELIDLINPNNYSKYLSDGAHPNTKGHELIFNKVKKFLESKVLV